MQLFGPLYERVLGWAGHRYAERYLAGLSFAESSFFPIPPDVMLAPMCLARRDLAWRFAAVTTITSVLGGILGYFIGVFLFDYLEPWLQTTHYWASYLKGREWFEAYGVWVVLIAGFSPIPYKVFTITAGVAAMNLPAFIIASAIGRGARFFLVAGLIVAGGDRMADTIDKHIERIGWAAVVLVAAVVAFLMLR